LHWSCVVKDLVTMNHLSKLVTDSGKLTIEDRVGRLIKLHHVLEMTVMLEQCLNLPHHLLCSAARSAFFRHLHMGHYFVIVKCEYPENHPVRTLELQNRPDPFPGKSFLACNSKIA